MMKLGRKEKRTVARILCVPFFEKAPWGFIRKDSVGTIPEAVLSAYIKCDEIIWSNKYKVWQIKVAGHIVEEVSPRYVVVKSYK